MTLSGIFFRLLGGMWSGITGAIVLGILLFFTWPIVGEILSPPEINQNEFGVYLNRPAIHPLFMSIVLVGVFLAGLIANLIYCIINSVLDDRYYLRATMITHTFIGNLVILVLMLPAYIIATQAYGSIGIAITAIVHTILASLFTFFVTEILSRSPYIFLSLYGAIVGLSLFVITANFMAGGSPTVLSFLTLPLLLGFLNAGNGIVEMFYFWFNKTYGVYFLETDKRFGTDYGDDSIVKEKASDDDEWDKL